MNKNDLEHIFQPFFRGKNVMSLDSEGKGLGLYISRYIVRSHGGDITLNNTYGNLFSHNDLSAVVMVSLIKPDNTGHGIFGILKNV